MLTNFQAPENFTHIEDVFAQELMYGEGNLDWLNGAIKGSIETSEDTGKQIFELADTIRLEVLDHISSGITNGEAQSLLSAAILEIDQYKVFRALIEKYKQTLQPV